MIKPPSTEAAPVAATPTPRDAVQRLRGARLDSNSGMHIGWLDLGAQTLRVGIRTGRAGQTPLLVFNGIGANMELVGPFLGEFKDVETIIFDVPGAGQSPPPRWPYRPFHIANLARRLLDALGYADAVDVMGVSWGGGMAQQFTIQFPQRVRRLILAATSMGGATMLPGNPMVLLKMVDPRRYIDKGYMKRIAPQLYGGRLRGEAEAIKLFTDHARGGDRRGYRYQLLVMLGWTSLFWLWRIHHPTLLLAGSDDPLVPLVNARLHARLLKNARLRVIDDGHLFLLTRAREMAGEVHEFLRATPQAV